METFPIKNDWWNIVWVTVINVLLTLAIIIEIIPDGLFDLNPYLKVIAIVAKVLCICIIGILWYFYYNWGYAT